jgi:8-oxo-dGTP pyrophosphatase MutT (NUDIX family)
VSVAPEWVAAARAAALRPPLQPRQPVWVQGHAVGSVAQGILNEIGQGFLSSNGFLLSNEEFEGQAIWHLRGDGDPSAALNQLAQGLRGAGQCGPWRNEQLAVWTLRGERLGTIERGAVRPLGLATCAVHLVAWAPDGRMWVQQRAFDKPNNPGMWDTLMGGMVSAQDDLTQALARETWEEAGLQVTQLQQLRHGGHVDFAQPSDEAQGSGYMVERIDWFAAQVPEGMQPENQDGEVAGFELLTQQVLLQRLAQGTFTPEASLVLAAALGW